MDLKTLVLGGYGNFGARICRALAGDDSIALLVAGRNVQRATALAEQLGHGARGIGIDHTAPDFANQLKTLGVELLIHTAGPFQHQATDVVQAAAHAGAHYIDLADGRRFVCDFPQALQSLFVAAGRTAICGASTVPALSSAVVAHLTQDWQRIDTIDLCIAPAQKAPRGKATLAAVLSYCGEAISIWNQGQWQTQRGWARPQPVHFARLRPRLGALCDIPDLELFPHHFGVTQRVMFRAALEVGLAQRAFALLADLRARRLLPNPAKLAGFLNTTAPVLDFLGTPLGGMVVRVQGIDAQGKSAQRAWHVAADHDHGPEIPCMAAIVLARRLAQGEVLPSGAFACMGMVALAEFQPEFDRWGMVCDVVDEGERDGPPKV